MAFSGGVNLRLVKCAAIPAIGPAADAAALQVAVNAFTASLSNQTTERGDVLLDIQYLAPSATAWVAIITYVGIA